MIKVSASGLKAKMGQYMRAVRSGKEVLVTDRDQPVARLVPVARAPEVEGLVWSQPRDPTAPPLGQVKVKAVHIRGIDTNALLREDRSRR